MAHDADYWRNNPDAPFAELIATVSAMCHPEVSELYDQLIELARDPEPGEKTRLFKVQLQEALLDPAKLPENALFDAAEYDDGSEVRFMRRLWRDLYPDEPVPGGDEEFREHLRQMIRGEVDLVPDTIDYYLNRLDWPKTQEERSARAREIWERFYPGEPVP